MNSPLDLELVRSARADLDQVREALLAPSLDTLLEAAPVLERSAEALSSLEAHVRRRVDDDTVLNSCLRNELAGLRRSLDGIQSLISNAASFHAGWAGLVGACSTSYSPSGALVHAPVELKPVVVRG